MIELAWVPFVILFLCFGAYVAEHWPRHDPTDDDLYERRRDR